MSKAEIAYSNKRQREVFGWSDEDQEREDRKEEYFAKFLVGLMLVGLLVVCFVYPHGF